MDWSAAKNLVVQSVGFDGATTNSLSQTTIGTPTDTKLQLCLRNFSIEIASFFTRAVPVTFENGDWESVDLTDGSRCTLAMSKVLELSFNGQKLCKVAGVGLLRPDLSNDTGVPTAGTPICWAESDLGKIEFDRPITQQTPALPGWVAGWYRHPVLTFDTAANAVTAGFPASQGTFQIDETVAFAWAKYASIFLSESVGTAASTIERLKRYDVQAYNLIKQKRGENLARYSRGLYGRSRGLTENWGWGWGFGWGR